MSSVTQSAVEAIAHDIEEKLFNLNQDINPKYKNKYRSLIFNLKDSKNQGLFRKVLTKEIGSRELVRMSSEKLASKELAAWRESTLKKVGTSSIGLLGKVNCYCDYYMFMYSVLITPRVLDNTDSKRCL